jgi:hypothetical protein
LNRKKRKKIANALVPNRPSEQIFGCALGQAPGDSGALNSPGNSTDVAGVPAAATGLASLGAASDDRRGALPAK